MSDYKWHWYKNLKTKEVVQLAAATYSLKDDYLVMNVDGHLVIPEDLVEMTADEIKLYKLKS